MGAVTVRTINNGISPCDIISTAEKNLTTVSLIQEKKVQELKDFTHKVKGRKTKLNLTHMDKNVFCYFRIWWTK